MQQLGYRAIPRQPVDLECCRWKRATLDAPSFFSHNRLSIGFCRDGGQRAGCDWFLDRRGRRPSKHLACQGCSDGCFIRVRPLCDGASASAGRFRFRGDHQAGVVVAARARQLLDAGIGAIQHDPGQIGGPLVIAVLQMLALWGLFRSISKQPVPSSAA
jgi:hypothetical protein